MTSAAAPDPRDVRVAHVLKDGTPAATLERTADGVRFDYRWLSW